MKPIMFPGHLDSNAHTYRLLAQLEDTAVLVDNSKTHQIKDTLLSHNIK